MKNRLRMGDIEQTVLTKKFKGVNKPTANAWLKGLRFKIRARIGDITRIEGMRIIWPARVKRGRTGSKEQAEYWEDVKETHEAGKVGCNANARSEDKVRM
jgi:hypothetical protein